jgi:hypothetical protein
VGAILLVWAVASQPASEALAQGDEALQSQKTPTSSAPAKKTKPRAKGAAKLAPPSAPAAPPCARGQWKDDPACFGENDPSALPTPNGASAAGHAGDVSFTPKAGLNTAPRAQQDPIPFTGNSPSPKPSNNDFGGGVGVNFPF